MTTEIDIDPSKTYVIDTYAWYEYFTGSDIGIRIKDFIEKGNLITPSIVVAEIVNKFTREGKTYAEFVQFLKLRSEIVSVDSEVAEEAGNLRTRFSKNKISMADAIIMAVAKIRNIKIVSGDEHFRDLKNVIMIK
ncbi:MAG: PIN domain-containing protein [Candidatus Aenigmatarchaeota archaeon]